MSVIKRFPNKGRAAAAAVAVLAAGAFFVAGRGGRAAEETGAASAAVQQAAATVTVATVAEERLSLPVEVTGTVQAALRAEVSPKIMGKVARVLVREGDRVRAGQALVELEAADLQAAVAQAQAAVESAGAAVKQARTGAQIQTTQSSTRVGQAKAALQAAREQLSLVTEGPRKQQKLQADLAVSEAEAAVAQAQANLSLVREGARSQQKLQARQGVLQAEAQLRTAKANYDRYRTLFEQDVIARQRFDEVVLAYESAQAQHEIALQQASLVNEGARAQEVQAAEEAVRQAEARLAMARQQRELSHEGGREQEIAAARAQVRQAEENLRLAMAATAENSIKHDHIALLQAQQRQAEAALRAAQVQAGYATLTAPFPGVVTARLVDPGDMAAPGMPAVRIEDAGAFRLEVSVSESRMTGIALGQNVTVALDSLRWRGEGRVVEIVPGADPASRTFVVKVGLQGVPGLASGVFGKALFPGETRTRLVVPEAALVRRGQLESVVVVSAEGTARVRLVRAGETANGQVELLSGVQPGDRVVTSSPERLADGERVALH